MNLDVPMTVLLPISDDASTVLNLLYDLPDPKHLFEFMLMHVVPGRLILKVGHTFALQLAVAKQTPYPPRFRIVDPAFAESEPTGITGQIASSGVYLNDNLITYTASITYGPADAFVNKLAEKSAR